MFCPKCGHEAESNSSFCTSCATRFEPEAPRPHRTIPPPKAANCIECRNPVIGKGLVCANCATRKAQPRPTATPNNVSKKRRAPQVLAVVAVALIAVFGIGTFASHSRNSSPMGRYDSVQVPSGTEIPGNSSAVQSTTSIQPLQTPSEQLVRCPPCQGSGQVFAWFESKPCDHCGGKGFTVDWQNHAIQCTFCRGTGQVDDLSKPIHNKCELCGGSGLVSPGAASAALNASGGGSQVHVLHDNDYLPQKAQNYNNLLNGGK